MYSFYTHTHSSSHWSEGESGGGAGLMGQLREVAWSALGPDTAVAGAGGAAQQAVSRRGYDLDGLLAGSRSVFHPPSALQGASVSW